MKVLFDTNIILDFALQRDEYFSDTLKLFKLIENNSIEGHLTATTITDIYYITKKQKGHKVAIRFIKSLTELFEIIGVDRSIILEALKSTNYDFEDSIQSMAASFNGLKTIITRNVKDFNHKDVYACSPKEFLEKHN